MSATQGTSTASPPLTIGGWLRFDAIRRAISRVAPDTVLELGAGEGALATWLAARVNYRGVEPDERARNVATHRLAGRSAEVVRDLADLDVTCFDLLCAFEVLEHIDDDTGALVEWSGYLERHGWLVVSVPGHARRFGPSDSLVGHVRRYDAPDLRALLDVSGFDIVTLESYGAVVGQGLDQMRNVLARRMDPPDLQMATAGSGRHTQPRSRAGARARALAALPGRVLQWPFRNSDIGIGYVALARARR